MSDFLTIIAKPSPHTVFEPLLDAARRRYEDGQVRDLLIKLRARRSEMRTSLERARAGYNRDVSEMAKAGIAHFDADAMVKRLGELIAALEAEIAAEKAVA